MADSSQLPTSALRGFAASTTTTPDTPTESERRWLYMPVACTAFLILVVFAGSIRSFWRISRPRAEAEESRKRKPWWPWKYCYGCIKYMLRFSGGVGLAAGIFGLIIAARRFYEHWDQVRAGAVNFWFILLPALTYVFLVVAFFFAGLGLQWKTDETEHAKKVYLALRQNATFSLLAALASGISQEVLCGVDNKTFNVPDGWTESCQMLGGSCALLLLGILTAQADGVEKRDFEPAKPEKPKEAQPDLARQESCNASLLDKGEDLFNRLGPADTTDMDSRDKSFWSPEHPLPEERAESGEARHGLDDISPNHAVYRGLQEPLLGTAPPWYYESETGYESPDETSRYEDPLDFPREVDESYGSFQAGHEDEQLLPGAFSREAPVLSEGSGLSGAWSSVCGFTPRSSSLIASPPMRPTVLAV